MISEFTAIAMLAACLTYVQQDDSDMSKYVQANGKLKDRLVVQDSQAGVVGRAGTEIVIEPDGTWTKTQFWGEKRRKELGRGKLSTDEVAKLARVLVEQKASRLPREFGKTDATTNPNPHYLILEFGSERSKLLLPPKTAVNDYIKSASEEQRTAARRFDAIIAEVKKLAGEAR